MKKAHKKKKDIKKKKLYQEEKLTRNTILLEDYNKEDLQNTLELGDTQSLLNLLHELILQSYKIEKEFKDFKVLIESILEMIPQAVVVFNDNGSLFYQNKKASNLKGLLEVDIGDLSEVEMKIDNNTFLIQSSRVSHKQIITATNITEQKRQERLANMGQVSAHLAHEIRNPIGSLSLLAGVLSKRVDESSLEIVDEMKKYIQAHYSENIQLIDLSEEFNLSPKYCSEVFNRLSGENFKNYLNRFRINEAQRILDENPEIRITQLASEVGFSSSNSFIRVFDKYMGITPKQYAESRKKES